MNELRHHLTRLATILTLALLPGCAWETREISSTWDAYEQLAWADRRSANDNPDQVRAWTIRAATYEGPRRHEAATTAATALQNNRDLDLNHAWIEDIQGMTYVYAGQFRRIDDRQTRQTLRAVRRFELHDGRPFSSAQFMPLSGTLLPSADPLDLAAHTGRYSLQIAAYDRAFGDRFRQAAEDAAANLREEGEEAFFYHGPHRSLVTIGLFEDRDFVTNAQGFRGYGPRIHQLQQRYPYNLLNGLTLEESKDGQSLGNQPSALVRVP
ncbi:hypothetical protein [Mucisphaera sp.]|uniref:hypothetical protein n=1 Tax=Mucisphaera sp. TaxID=2913024 RepID=UPI003D14EC91